MHEVCLEHILIRKLAMKQVKTEILLGVNVDHVATLRQVRGVTYPSPLQAAEIVEQAGGDGITIHLREDRRHIQDDDVHAIKQQSRLPLNLEMAATAEMQAIAINVKPTECCLVPEKREELTTEGGLDVTRQADYLRDYCAALREAGITVSLFIDPDPAQIECASNIGAPMIELHTGAYAEADSNEIKLELDRLINAVDLGLENGLIVNAGHGLHYDNVDDIAAIPGILCLNIGHSIVAEAVMTGMFEAVSRMKTLMLTARGRSLAKS